MRGTGNVASMTSMRISFSSLSEKHKLEISYEIHRKIGCGMGCFTWLRIEVRSVALLSRSVPVGSVNGREFLD
jgi:hypothetical protein